MLIMAGVRSVGGVIVAAVRIMRMTMTSMIVATMRVPMVCMAKGGHANDINDEPQAADDKKLPNPVHLTTFNKSLNSFVDDLNANEPIKSVSIVRFPEEWRTHIKNIPLAKPASVSIFP